MRTFTHWYKSPLVFFHVLSHASIIPMLMYAEIWQWIVALIVYFMFACWGISLTYHRLIAHKSYEAPTWFKVGGMIFGSLGAVGSTIQWTALHRDHHKHTDGSNDPHNPAGGFIRFLQVQFLAMLAPSSPKYVTDLLRDPLHQKFHTYYWIIHLVYATILFSIDPFAIVYAYLFPALLLWHIMTAISTFSHFPKFGKQPFVTNDKSTNIWIIGLLAFGEGWHNNHHKYPNSPKFGGNSWWEFDFSYRVIKLIQKKS